MADTNIEWASKVWNPSRGCRRVSPGCGGGTGAGPEGGCYAERQAHRFSGPGQPYEGLTRLTSKGPRWTGEARFVPEMLRVPLSWRKPERIFVDSMSDLFHEDITNEQIAAVFAIMGACHRHTFMILTKRHERMRAWFEWVASSSHEGMEFGLLHDAIGQLAYIVDPGDKGINRESTFDRHMEALMGVEWPLRNVWLGVSAEDQQRADERIPALLQCPAAVRFVSAEPLLGPIDFSAVAMPDSWRTEDDLADSIDALRHHPSHLDLVIVGGESGPGARGCDMDWISSILAQCKAAGVAAFNKQLGSYPYEVREAEGGARGTDEALASLGEPHPQREWFPVDQGWCLTHTPDGRSRWIRNWHGRLKHRKGGDPAEWPESLRVRELPEARA